MFINLYILTKYTENHVLHFTCASNSWTQRRVSCSWATRERSCKFVASASWHRSQVSTSLSTLLQVRKQGRDGDHEEGVNSLITANSIIWFMWTCTTMIPIFLHIKSQTGSTKHSLCTAWHPKLRHVGRNGEVSNAQDKTQLPLGIHEGIAHLYVGWVNVQPLIFFCLGYFTCSSEESQNRGYKPLWRAAQQQQKYWTFLLHCYLIFHLIKVVFLSA